MLQRSTQIVHDVTLAGNAHVSLRPRPCRIILVFLVCAFVFLPASSLQAQDPYAGKIAAINSGASPQIVSILRAGKNGYAKARTGDAVFVGDTVKTAPGIRAQIELPDRSLINIGPDSTLQVKGHLFVPAEAKRNYVFKALKGVMRFIIANSFTSAGSGSSLRWKDSSVIVETITAVAGVRGTDFIVTSLVDSDDPVVEIAVLEGVVRVRNVSLTVKEAVMLIGNRITSVKRGEAPAAAADLPQARRDELIELTKIAPSVPAERPSAEKKSGPGKYTNGDAERDLAAGSILAEVFARAAEAGMSVHQMIDAVLTAGVSPYVVVYTAITEGFHVEAVVSAAIRCGAPLNSVVLAATMAGAEMASIISGAADTGAPPEAIATAVANAEAPGAPVYGYTLPVTPPIRESVIIPPALVIAPSGATPLASPYKP